MTSLHLHLDPIGGLAGNLMLGALAQLGVSLPGLESELRAQLCLDGFSIRSETVELGAISAICVSVEVEGEQPARHFSEIQAMLGVSSLPSRVKARALRTFTCLAEAEATVHGSTPEAVHFHEVGAVDALVDIVGSALGLEHLGVDSLSATPPPLGSGLTHSAHGVIPLPAPATLELLKGTRLHHVPVEGEMTTPTGAALLRALVGTPQVNAPALVLSAIGHGAGHARWPDRPNLLRVLLGTLAEEQVRAPETPPLGHRTHRFELKAQVDDLPPEQAAYCLTRLLEAGALEAYLTPIVMKKGRPGLQFTVHTRAEELASLQELLLRESGSLGLRVAPIERLELERRQLSVETAYGPVPVKLGMIRGEAVIVAPEFEACARCARAEGVSLARVYAAAQSAFEAESGARVEASAEHANPAKSVAASPAPGSEK